MLKANDLVDIFEGHFLAQYEDADRAHLVAGLRAVEAAVRADQIRKDAAIVKVSIGSQWGIAAAIRAYLIEGNTDD